MKRHIHTFLNYLIASVWLINGLFCKVLDLVPRHSEIVGALLGNTHSSIMTIVIGISEILMAIWIVSKFKSRLNAIAQITIVITMNIIEFTFTPHLLLWGKMNLIFALIFVTIIYLNEFKLNQNPS